MHDQSDTVRGLSRRAGGQTQAIVDRRNCLPTVITRAAGQGYN
jgi:hypothetical protein